MIHLQKPELQDLAFIDLLWRDEQTMQPVGGPVRLSKEKLESWYKRMVEPGSPKDRYYLIFENDRPVGEASFHRYDPITKTGELNIKVLASCRGRGIAKDALKQLLTCYFYDFKADAIFDAVAPKNSGGQKFLADFGFMPLKRDHEAVVFKLSREQFESIIAR